MNTYQFVVEVRNKYTRRLHGFAVEVVATTTTIAELKMRSVLGHHNHRVTRIYRVKEV